MELFKSGYVGIVGKPNVGKSTLLNRLLGEKLSIVSPLPQTTRNRIMGILTESHYQIIFMDTPGIHAPKDQLHKFMMQEIETTINDVDLVVFMMEYQKKLFPEDEMVFQYFQKIKTPKIVVINKVDLCKSKEFPFPAWLKRLELPENLILLSALQGTNCDVLLEKIIALLPEGPPYYSDDTLTDRPERFFIAEIIREKAYGALREELPYSLAVVTEEFKEREKNKYFIRAVLYTEKDSQKGILIGSQGKMLKKIGTAARKEIEIFLGKQVYLELWVKVRNNWRKNPSALKEFGLDD